MEYRGFEPLSCTFLYKDLSAIETKCTPKNEKAGVSPAYAHSTTNSPYFSQLQHNSQRNRTSSLATIARATFSFMYII